MGSRQQGFNSIQQLAGEYLLSTYKDYANIRSLLIFKCKDCKTEINTTSFLYGKSEDGKKCLSCKQKLKIDSLDAQQVFINRCIKIHGDYFDYSLLPSSFKLTEKINIICPKHGIFSQSADSHKHGSGCKICKIDTISQVNRSNKTDFIINSNKIHNFKYNYNGIQYINAITPVSIICSKHGEFYQTPDVHLQGSGCVKCTSSNPIKRLITVLQKHNIIYSLEKTFQGCIGIKGKLLRFDIFVPSLNICIEYDGPHHYKPINYGGFNTKDELNNILEIQQTNDEIKNKYCEEHNIRLLRIPYTRLHPDTILDKLLVELDHSNRYYYTYDMLSTDILSITQYIKSFGYDKFAVYGIARGGLFFSVPVSYHFDGICEYGIVSYQRYDGNDSKVRFDIIHNDPNIPIFVIDDLISSGITMDKVVKSLQHKFKKAKIHPIVIFGDENSNNVFFIKEHPKQWVVFPYEL